MLKCFEIHVAVSCKALVVTKNERKFRFSSLNFDFNTFSETAYFEKLQEFQ